MDFKLVDRIVSLRSNNASVILQCTTTARISYNSARTFLLCFCQALFRLGHFVFFVHHSADLHDSTHFKLRKAHKHRPAVISIFIFLYSSLHEALHVSLLSRTLHPDFLLVSSFRNINHFSLFKKSLLLFEWRLKHSTIHMTVEECFL